MFLKKILFENVCQLAVIITSYHEYNVSVLAFLGKSTFEDAQLRLREPLKQNDGIVVNGTRTARPSSTWSWAIYCKYMALFRAEGKKRFHVMEPNYLR